MVNNIYQFIFFGVTGYIIIVCLIEAAAWIMLQNLFNPFNLEIWQSRFSIIIGIVSGIAGVLVYER
jgi:hypothetical protein